MTDLAYWTPTIQFLINDSKKSKNRNEEQKAGCAYVGKHFQVKIELQLLGMGWRGRDRAARGEQKPRANKQIYSLEEYYMGMDWGGAASGSAKSNQILYPELLLDVGFRVYCGSLYMT